MEKLLTFQKFTTKAAASDLETILKENSIIYVEGDSTSIDANFIGNAANAEFRIKIKASDFEKVDELLEAVIKKELEQVDPDHYLFQFSDEELFEVLRAEDEWSQYDYLLAQKILEERGKEINPAVVQLLQKQRIAQLSKPEESKEMLVFTGYVFAMLGGLLGILIGLSLCWHKKTLPNGESLFVYKKSDREHGSKIAIIGVMMLLIIIIYRLIVFYDMLN
jgi:hypothetical protein